MVLKTLMSITTGAPLIMERAAHKIKQNECSYSHSLGPSGSMGLDTLCRVRRMPFTNRQANTRL